MARSANKYAPVSIPDKKKQAEWDRQHDKLIENVKRMQRDLDKFRAIELDQRQLFIDLLKKSLEKELRA